MGLNMPPFHRRLMDAGLDLCEEYGLFLAGGYAMKAHGLVDRPSRDIDFATDHPLPVDELTARVVAWYQAKGFTVEARPGNYRFARLLISDLLDDHEFQDYGLTLEEVRRVKRFAAEWAQDINLRLLEEEEVDLNL